MITLKGSRLKLDVLDKHVRICDLLEFEGPVLSLYSDGRRSWLYLWCDTDNVDTNRWLIFQCDRSSLVSYLEGKENLLDLLQSSSRRCILDDVYRPAVNGKLASHRRYLTSINDLSLIADYLPTDQSFFDESLAPDIDVARQLIPSTFNVPINTGWFATDFKDFFKSYARVYSFFYATRPQFVRSIEHRMADLLRAPWTGGYSRINFFASLPDLVPALHGLRIPRMGFASPGDIQFEALESVGASIRESTLRLLDHEASVQDALAAMKLVLSKSRLNRIDLSQETDDSLNLATEEKALLSAKCAAIAASLGMEAEFASLRRCSPNVVVYSKAVAGLLTQLRQLAQFEVDGMLEFHRHNQT